VARRFATDDIFYAIRLEPYLVATAAAHPDLEANLLGLLARTAITKLCLVPATSAPKTSLSGRTGRCFSTPNARGTAIRPSTSRSASNHLLLKCLWVPQAKSGFLNCFAPCGAVISSAMSFEIQVA